MSTPETPVKPHSAEYFGEQRDYWYNADFIALMARRWRLDAVRLALDVGAGVGHWGRILIPHLQPDAQVIGIDREEGWIREAGERAAKLGLADRMSYRFGDAQSIPFDDGTFDLVTCQTLLIHVSDPRAVLRQMMRVLKPGGLLAVAEPNNLANIPVLGSTLFHAEPERILDLVRLELLCERGKESLGEGNNSIGEMLPGYFAEVGLEDVMVYLSDKASSMIPPYRSREQEARRDEVIEWTEREMFGWDRRDLHRYVRAGGATEAEFERLWSVAGEAWRDIAAALRAGKEHQAGAGVQYLISGRKAG